MTMTMTAPEVTVACLCCAMLAFVAGYALGQMRELTRSQQQQAALLQSMQDALKPLTTDPLLRAKLEDL
jgi:hypothetical protein